MNGLRKKLSSLNESIHIAPLAVFRVAFGAIMFISVIRFILKGWVKAFYIDPKFYFPFYGFEWVKPLGEEGMYLLFGVMAITSFAIMLGLFYRISSIVFFLSFTYVELIDKTYYLNHYYFVSIIAFLLMLVPAHRYFSIDCKINPTLQITHVPEWTISIFKWQLCLVYFFAGVAKLNIEWMLNAMPLKIWLPQHAHLPIVGSFLEESWVAYAFSWFGVLYDLFIWIFLMNNRTRGVAYIFVVVFHLCTAFLFPIGMFPYIMIIVTLIFFSENFHIKLIESVSKFLRITFDGHSKKIAYSSTKNKLVGVIISLYFIFQITLPLRFLFYPGNLFWTEQGFRFSWRVMLMEKRGLGFFYIKDPSTGIKSEVRNASYLTPMQESMMASQPDMILQYAHLLRNECIKNGIKNPVITTEIYVSLNGRRSELFTDSTVNMAMEKESFFPYSWVLPYKD